MKLYPLSNLLLPLALIASANAADDLADQVLDQRQKETQQEKKSKFDFLEKHPTLVKMWVHANKIRKEYGLVEQNLSPELTKAAQDHAWYMARTHQFSHYTNGGYVARMRRHKYQGAPNGEIILYGAKNIPSAFTMWLNSPPHRAILLGGGKEVGYGYAISANGTAYWVGVYGTPVKKTKPKKPASVSN